jgi:site-specific DNA-methyltransferase (adenine-specific)
VSVDRSAPFARLASPGGSPVLLWAEDCLEGLPRRVGPGGADVVVTSPPYNRGVAYGRYDDRRPRTEYLAWIGRIADAVRAALAPDGSFFLNVGGSPTDPWLPLDVAQEVRQRLVLQNVIHWVKSIAIERALVGTTPYLTGDIAVGHYKPVPSRRFLHGAQEYVFHFTHRGDVPLDRLALGVPYQDASNVGRWRGATQGLRCRGNTWFLPYATIRRRATDRPHPATFPPELPERCYRLHGRDRIRLAVDPFVGLGSSAVAAARLGVPFIGFDVDAGYLDVAARRVREALVSRPVRVPPGAARRRKSHPFRRRH